MENLENNLKKSNFKKKTALFVFCNIFAIGLLLLISLYGLSFATSPNFLGTENSTVEYAEAGSSDPTLTLNTNGGNGGTTGDLTCRRETQSTGRGGSSTISIKDSNGTVVYSYTSGASMGDAFSSGSNTGITCPTRTGYTFGGYFANTDGSGTKYIDSSGKLVNDQNTLYYDFRSSTATAYAHWIANTYSVVFNGNGNTGGSTATQSFTYATAQNLNANGFTKTGCTFAGWATSAGGSVAYSNSQNVNNLTSTNGGTFNLYACWTANTYTISYTLNGGTNNSSNPSSYTYGTGATLYNPTRTGYTFNGWYEGSTNVTSISSSATGNKTLTASWDANQYTLSFNSNGGSSVASKGVTFNSQIGSLPTPTKPGHTFNGWKIGTTAIYSSTSWTYTANQTATAQWTQNSYTLTINYGNGAANGSQSVVYGQNVSLGTPSKTGYTFAGWSLAGVGGVNSSFTYNYETNKTITAQWNKNTYYVAFNGNGYTGGSTATQTFTYDTAQSLRANGFTRTGYTFAGWATSANGNVAYSNSQNVSNLTSTNGGTFNLYAKWNPIKYKVIFNGNGSSSGSMSEQEFTYGSAQNLKGNSFSKTGHTFAGWATSAGGTTAYSNSQSVNNLTSTANGTVTLYAKWTANTFTLQFNGNGNTGGSTASKTLTYNTSNSLTANGFKKTGYDFKNWNTSADGNGATFANNASLSAEQVTTFYGAVGKGGTVTLYAQWTPIGFNISFSANASSSTKPVRYIKDFVDGNTQNGSSHFIEIQAFDANGTNVALNKKVTSYNGDAQKVTDGITDCDQWPDIKASQWVIVDLGAVYNISYIKIYHYYGDSRAYYGTKTQISTTGIDYTTVFDSNSTYNNMSAKMYKETSAGHTIYLGNNVAFNGSIANITPKYDNTATLPSNYVTVNGASLPIIYREGYVFNGWNTSADGHGTHFDNGKTLSTSDVNSLYSSNTRTLYAEFIKSGTSTLTIDPNGGTFSGQTSVTQNIGTTVNVPYPTKPGYAFTGWTISNQTANLNFLKNATLKASLVANSSSATKPTPYGAGGSTPTITTVAKADSSTGYAYEISGTSNTGFSQTISSVPSGTFIHIFNACVPVGKTLTIASNNLYGSLSTDGGAKWITGNVGTGQWETYAYFVTSGLYNAGWSSWTNTYGSSFGFIYVSNGVTWHLRDNYIYQLTSAENYNSFNLEYEFGAQNTTLTANYVALGMKATLDYNGGTCSNASSYQYGVGFRYDSTYNSKQLPDRNKMSHEGKVFSGWYTAASGGTKLSDENGVLLASVSGYTDSNRKWLVYDKNITLYAQYNHRGVTFDANGGNVTPSAKIVAYGSIYGTLPTPTRNYHDFDGWFTAASGGTQVKASDTCLTNNTTLYAHWTPTIIVITLDNQSATTAGTANFVYIYRTNTYFTNVNVNSQIYAITIPQKTGHTFGGYFSSPNGAGTQYVSANGQFVNNLSNSFLTNTTLYAKWTPNEYKITFHLNYGTSSATLPTKHTYGTATAIPDASALTKKGYEFKGWFTNSSLTGSAITSISATGYTADINLYAKWEAKKYTLSFNPNGGSAVGTTIQVTFDKEIGALPTTTKTGYTPSAWKINNNPISSSYKWNIEGDATATVSWTANTYSIVFNANGGSGTMGNQTFTYDSSATLNANAFSKTGYTFQGWATSADGAVAYANNKAFTKEEVNSLYSSVGKGGKHNLFAVWKANSYKVVFHKNDGTDTKDEQEFTYGVTGNLKPNAFTRTGYTFAGWATSSNGSKAYDDKASVTNWANTQGAKIDLYAVWIAEEYNIFYKDKDNADFSGSISGTYPNKHIYNQTTTLASDPTLITKTGYTFSGWFLDAACTGSEITSLAANTYTADIVLYAKWTPNTYTLSFNTNGGSAVAPITVTYDSAIGNLNSSNRNGYTFSGWILNEVALKSTDIWKYAEDMEATASWENNKFNIVFNTNGGSGTMGNQELTFDTAATLNANTFTRRGYTFQGWATSSNGTKAYDNEQDLTIADVNAIYNNNSLSNGSNTTLYAVWKANSYKVVFHANDGTGSMDNQEFEYDTAQSLTANAFEKYGFDFIGWAIAADGEVVYENSQSVSNLSNVQGDTISLYAVWEAKTVTLHFDSKGGDTVDSLQMTFGELLGTLPVTTKEGYIFTTWRLNGLDIDENCIWNYVEEQTAEAVWKPITYTIIFNANTGSGTMGNQTFTYDAVQNLTTNAFTKTGYTFSGWARTDNGEKAFDDQDQILNLTNENEKEITLYAVWTVNSYTVSYMDKDNETFSGLNNDTLPHNYVYDTELHIDDGVKTGYAFGGWFLNAACTGSPITSLAANTYAHDIVLYATWTPITYTLNFNPNGGLPVDSMPVTYDSKVGTLPTPTRDGYTFTHWTLDDVEINENTFWNTYTENKTAVAQWTANQYELTFDFNLDNVEDEKISVIFDTEIGELPSPTKIGYTFSGWKIDETIILATTHYTYPHDTTAVAQWTANKYYIDFDPESGLGTMSRQEFTYDIAAKLSANTFTKTGYTFSGWVFNANQSVIYLDEQLVANLTTTNDEVLVLIAIWSADSYTLTFDANLGEVSPTTQVVTFDKTIEELPTPTRTGYDFVCWLIVDENDELQIGETWTYNCGKTATAQWTPKEYTLTLQYENGETDDTQQTVTFDAAIGLLPTPSKTGYTFVAWTIDATPIDASTVWKHITDKTAIATWSPITYYVKFDTNAENVTGTMANQEFVYDATTTLNPGNYKRAGYNFKGWATSSNGTKIYEDRNEVLNLAINDGEIVTLFAVWEAKTYSISYFDLNGGAFSGISAETLPSEHIFDQETPIPHNPLNFTKKGYTFAHWYIGDNQITALAAGEYLDAISLYATWTPNTYMLSFDSNEGSAVLPQEVTFDAKVGELPKPTRKGYDFLKWTIDGIDITEESYWNTYAEDKEAVAVWTPCTYILTFQYNNGEYSSASQIVFDSTLGPLPTPTRDGHDFDGWFFDETFSIPASETTLVDFDHNATLYAKWNIRYYDISFEVNDETLGSLSSISTLIHIAWGTPITCLENVVNIGGILSVTAEPKKLFGYIAKLDKWEINDEVIENTYVKCDTLIKAFFIKEAKTLTLKFNLNTKDTDGNDLVGKPTLDGNKTLELTFGTNYSILPTPTLKGYVFEGWYFDPLYLYKVDINSTITNENDFTIYAKWSKEPTPLNWVEVIIIIAAAVICTVTVIVVVVYVRKSKNDSRFDMSN